jgi:hypothetical protein
LFLTTTCMRVFIIIQQKHHMFGFMLSRVAIFIPSDASHCICKAIVYISCMSS